MADLLKLDIWHFEIWNLIPSSGKRNLEHKRFVKSPEKPGQKLKVKQKTVIIVYTKIWEINHK